MLITLVTYAKGKNSVHVLYNPQERSVHIRHDDTRGFSQYPIRYASFGDHDIVYDRTPVKYIVPLIHKAFRAKLALEFALRHVGAWHTFAKSETDVILDLQRAGYVVTSGNQFMATER